LEDWHVQNPSQEIHSQQILVLRAYISFLWGDHCGIRLTTPHPYILPSDSLFLPEVYLVPMRCIDVTDPPSQAGGATAVDVSSSGIVLGPLLPESWNIHWGEYCGIRLPPYYPCYVHQLQIRLIRPAIYPSSALRILLSRENPAFS
jgi:hypothetical protein